MDDSWVTDDNNNNNFQFSVLGCLHYFPHGQYQTLLLTPLQPREQGWHLAHWGSVNIQRVIVKDFYLLIYNPESKVGTLPTQKVWIIKKIFQSKSSLLTSLQSIKQYWDLVKLYNVII